MNIYVCFTMETKYESTNFKAFVEKYVPKKKWERLIRYPRVDGKKVDFDFNSGDTGHYYKNSLVIEKVESGYHIETQTIWKGSLWSNFIAFYDDNFVLNMKDGFINCFGMGYMKMEFEYMEEYWEEIFESFEWDEIV